METIKELLNNTAFWLFLGTSVTAFFGYKEVVKKTPAAKAKSQAKNASSFEELRAVVEVLQDELLKKDKRHKDDADYMLSQLTEARSEVKSLTSKLAEALRKLTSAEDNAEKCREEVQRLRKLLLDKGISE